MAHERSFLVATASDSVTLVERLTKLGLSVDRLPILDPGSAASFRVKALGIEDDADLSDALSGLNAWEEDE